MSEEVPSWVKELTSDNFLAVYDVGLDIRQELQLEENPVIPLWQSAIKFSQLMPMDGVNWRDRYCDMRWKATGLLKKQGIINNFILLDGSHRWQSNLKINCDAGIFNSFMNIMDLEYSRRTKGSSNTGEVPKEDDNTSIGNNIESVRNIVNRFHAVVIQLRRRHDNRPTLDVSDEYDVQDLLRAI